MPTRHMLTPLEFKRNKLNTFFILILAQTGKHVDRHNAMLDNIRKIDLECWPAFSLIMHVGLAETNLA